MTSSSSEFNVLTTTPTTPTTPTSKKKKRKSPKGYRIWQRGLSKYIWSKVHMHVGAEFDIGYVEKLAKPIRSTQISDVKFHTSVRNSLDYLVAQGGMVKVSSGVYMVVAGVERYGMVSTSSGQPLPSLLDPPPTPSPSVGRRTQVNPNIPPSKDYTVQTDKVNEYDPKEDIDTLVELIFPNGIPPRHLDRVIVWYGETRDLLLLARTF